LVKITGEKKYTQANFFQACSYKAHRAAIFAISQLFVLDATKECDRIEYC